MVEADGEAVEIVCRDGVRLGGHIWARKGNSDCGGVVINPATPVDTLIEVLPMVHYVLVMSVNPGFGGQKFLPLAVEKIAYLAALRKEMSLNFRIEVDGGIAHDTVASVVEAGAEMLVAGSAVFSKGKTEQNAKRLLKLARAAEPDKAAKND